MSEGNIFQMEMTIGGLKARFRTHLRPHLDEIAAYWLIEKFGDSAFAKKYAVDGVITVGIGGGAFDEHLINANQQDPAKRECAATLVAKALGVADNSELRQILNYVKMRDQTSNAGNGLQGIDLTGFDVASGVKLLHSQNPDNPEVAFNWATALLEAKYQEQLHFFTATKAEFEAKSVVKEVEMGDGSLVRIVRITSDDLLISQYARSQMGAAIVIQQNTYGHVQISTDHKKVRPAHIDDLSRMLRLEEQKKRGEFLLVTNWDDLEREGVLVSDEDVTEDEKRLGLTVWFYLKTGRMLLNGSSTKPDVEKTVLTLEDITELAMIAIKPGLFPTACRELCSQGVCTSSKQNPCRWYPWGRSSCVKIRREMAQQSPERENKK